MIIIAFKRTREKHNTNFTRSVDFTSHDDCFWDPSLLSIHFFAFLKLCCYKVTELYISVFVTALPPKKNNGQNRIFEVEPTRSGEFKFFCSENEIRGPVEIINKRKRGKIDCRICNPICLDLCNRLNLSYQTQSDFCL